MTRSFQQLERIIHPLVEQAIDLFIRRYKHTVVVIEAIKLLEGNLIQRCDSVWCILCAGKSPMKTLASKKGVCRRQLLDNESRPNLPKKRK